jgi:hypothetical protein
MLAFDFVGMLVTICLIGLRYPHYVLMASLINGFGQVIMTLFLHGHIESVVAAGAFGSTMVSGIKGGVPAMLIIFAGALSNYIVSASAGGVEYEKTSDVLNPFSPVKHPFAVVNLRLALLSFIVNIWQII